MRARLTNCWRRIFPGNWKVEAGKVRAKRTSRFEVFRQQTPRPTHGGQALAPQSGGSEMTRLLTGCED